MQSSESSGAPRVLRCPQCGAPLDVPPHALTTRCTYCGHNVKLADPSPALPLPQPRKGSLRSVVVLIAVGTVAVFGAALVAHLSARSTPDSVATPAARATVEPVVRSSAPAPPAPEKAAAVRYPMRALLGVSTDVDIDGSRTHMLGLFPSIESERRADELRYVVPVHHRWFSSVELGWKNERAGKLTSVSFRPPEGDDKFENQDEIADCLAKGLGKPEVRETDHLAGEKSHFWGRHFPKAWANLYSGYLWLTFRNPEGIAPVTLPVIVRTLDGCTPQAP